MNRWTRNLLVGLAIGASGLTGLSVASGETPGPAADGFRAPAASPARAVQTEFVPVQPCRVADTRHGGGQLANNAARNFYIRGTFGFAPQGGTSGGCKIPVSATGVTANVTVTGVTRAGYLTGYPAGTGEPLTNFVSYSKGATVTSNPTFTLSPPTVDPQLTIRTHGSAAQVIIDVTGYYTPTLSGSVNADGSLSFHTSRVITSSYDMDSSEYTVTFDRDIATCAVTANPYRTGVGYIVVAPSGNKVVFLVRNYLGNLRTAQFYFDVVC